MTAEALKVGLPAVARPDARLFILGSLPGDASLAAARYYAHPTNQFWHLLGTVVDVDLPRLPYEQRLEVLGDRGVGLWDVIAAATRKGSLDQAIRDAQHNRIDHLLGGFPKLRAIAFNGTAAAAAGRKLIGAAAGAIDLVDLPSSSAANTRSLPAKAEAWSVLAQYLGREGSGLRSAQSTP
jgi:hypoxanthine-DNA glycosylase